VQDKQYIYHWCPSKFTVSKLEGWWGSSHWYTGSLWGISAYDLRMAPPENAQACEAWAWSCRGVSNCRGRVCRAMPCMPAAWQKSARELAGCAKGITVSSISFVTAICTTKTVTTDFFILYYLEPMRTFGWCVRRCRARRMTQLSAQGGHTIVRSRNTTSIWRLDLRRKRYVIVTCFVWSISWHVNHTALNVC